MNKRKKVCAGPYKNLFISQEEKILILEFILLKVWGSDLFSFGLDHTESKLMETML